MRQDAMKEQGTVKFEPTTKEGDENQFIVWEEVKSASTLRLKAKRSHGSSRAMRCRVCEGKVQS